MAISIWVWPGLFAFNGTQVVFVQPAAFPDGTSGAPAITFSGETTLGFTRLSASVIDVVGGSFRVGGSNTISWLSSTIINAPANGQFNITTNAGTVGAGFDVATDAIVKVRTRAQTGYATVDALAYKTSGVAGVGFALSTAQPADQTGNATSTLKMNGLGAAGAPATITPTSTGRVVFTVTGDLTNDTILDGVRYILVFGTGAAPANAAAVAGTAISATRSVAVPVAAQKQGFSVSGVTTGLALSTAVWYDLQISNVTGGTASVSNVTCTAYEI